ncbi:MAG: guanylate kinase [Lachnospiraceae bacterium]|nr:guanylate kinase [Lachnospiraceae bacterium]
MKSGILIVISGFSGAGKGTLVNRLIKEYDNYALSISMTTRKPRVGEENAKSYFFVSHEEFEQKIAEDGLLEYASYCDNYYGTPKSYVEEQLCAGKDVILEIEVQGALQIKEKYPNALLLFVTPPSAEILKNRLESRGTETQEVINKRMQTACKESEFMNRYDYIVVNDDLDTCVKDTHEMIRAAHFASNRSDAFIQMLKEGLLKLS